MSENILLDSLPETVMVDGKEFYIESDFRAGIIMEKILLSDMDDKDKILDLIGVFFPDEQPEDLNKAVDAILYMYRCGNDEPSKPRRKQKNGNVELKPKQIYSFEYDAPYIYGAFMSQYRIDLNEIEYLHWWKFQALFKSLNSDNKIVEIMGYRSADLSKIKNKAERDRIARMKNLFALPQNLTTEDKVALAGAAFGGAFM